MRFQPAWIVPLALAALASAAGTPAAADTTLVNAIVYDSSGNTTPHAITLGELQSDPTGCATYPGAGSGTLTEHGYQGVFNPQIPADAWSIQTILQCTNTISVGPDTSVTVSDASGQPEVSAYSQLTAAGQLGTALVSYFPGNPGPSYDRPWTGKPDDYDATDEITNDPNPIVLAVYNSQPALQVSVAAAQPTITAGDSDSFTATAPNATGPVKYAWSFGDGSPQQTASGPQETFAQAGTYDVSVLVTDSHGAAGTAYTTVTVNAANGQPQTPTGPTQQSGNGGPIGATSPTGPVHSGGGTPGGKPGPSEHGGGAAAGAGHRHHSRAPAKHHKTSSAPSSTTNGATTTPSASTTPGASTTPSGTAAQGTTPSSSSAQSTVRPRPRPVARAPHRRVIASAPKPQGQLVKGHLLGALDAVPPSQSPLVTTAQPAAPTAPPVRRGAHASVFPALGGTLAIVLLLGLGAARELRDSRWSALRAGL